MALLLAFIPRAHAGTCPIAAGTSSSIIVSTIGACTSGNTVTFAAGTYSIANTVTVPCGVSIAGPIVPLSTYTGADGYKREGYSPAAILNWTGSAPGRMFNRGACSTTASINYVECNMNHPSSAGGQCVYNGSVTSNFSEFGNYFHGNQGVGNDGPQVTSLDYFDGNQSASADTNISITWNRFGATGDCSTIMNVHTNYDGDCNGVSFHTPGSNITVNNNIFYYQENELKFYEGTGNGMYRCLTCTVEYNDFSNFHRIAFETQVNAPSSSGSPAVSMLIRYNSLHDPFNPSGITFGISAANGCDNTNPSPGGCVTNTDYNVIVDNVAAATGNLADGIEQWGSTGSTANFNLIQGEWANSIIINKDGAFSDYGNLIQSSYGAAGANNPADCYPAFFGGFGWWGVSNSPANTPVPTSAGGTNANTCSILNGTVQTSNSASASPSGGTVASGTVVTISAAGSNRDANTSAWCTTDGTTPVPGSGTATIMTSYTVLAAVTLKCVGMWGAANQPTAYPTGPLSGTYGYQPSAVDSFTYSVSGTPTAATPTFSPASETFTSPISVTISTTTPSATIYYTTNGSTPTTSSPVYSAPIAVSVTTTIQAIATASGYTQSAVGSSVYTYSPAVLASCYQSNSGSVTTLTAGSTPVQQIGMCHYGGSIADTTCSPGPDAYGNSIINWGSSNSAILNVGPTSAPTGCTSGSIGPGCAQGVTAGSANVTAIATGSVTCSAWAFTVSNPTLTGVTISLQAGGNTVVIGSPAQACATMTYSGASPTTVCGSGSDIYGTTPTGWTSTSTSNATISTSGLVTGVLAGSTTIDVSAGAFTATPEAITVTNAVASPSSFMGGQLIGGQIQ